MLRFSRSRLVFAWVAALALASGAADAQTTTATTTTPAPTQICTNTATTPTITATQQLAPERFVNGADLGVSTRPMALNPNGISFDDCERDMTLQFRVEACGFTGAYNLQVWASKTSDCTSAADRGSGGVAVCWLVSQGSTGLVQAAGEENYDVRVRDIVGPQNDSPSPGATMTSQGESACHAQASFLAVPININFVPINSSGAYAGSGALQFPMRTDMVGPPAPPKVSIKDGDTLFVLSWTPNVDTDTAAYDIVLDPAPGQAADATAATSGPQIVEICNDASASTPAPTATTDAASAGDAGDAGSLDDASLTTDATVTVDAAVAPTTASSGDASCYTITRVAVPVSGANSTCVVDPLLAGGSTSDASTSTTQPTTPQVNDSGLVTSGGVGGIWSPPAGHVIAPNDVTGTTVSGATAATYTLAGLTNGVTYNVVVAAVDGFGNIGPPSAQNCDYPALVNDFFKVYRGAGGGAGGGFCALEAVGAPAGSTVAFGGAGALLFAVVRRRRRRCP